MRGGFAILIVLVFGGLAAAQTPPPAAVLKFQEAEKRFQSGQLLEAAQLFQQLSVDEKAPNRDQSFDRLIAIYMRLGRCDQAIQTGDRYKAWLKVTGDVRTSRLVDVQMAACWWVLGHHATAEKLLAQAVATSLADFPLASQVAALELLARCQARRGDKLAAQRSWAKIEEFVTKRLRQNDDPVDDKERAELTHRWAEGLRGQERFGQAEVVLKMLFPLHDRLQDDAGKRDTWKELAALYREQGKLEAAESALAEALKLQASLKQIAAVAQADLEAERAEILQLSKKSKGAKEWRDKAIEHYQEAFKQPDLAVAQGTSPVLIFWKLQNLIQTAQQYRKALELTQTQAEQWAGGSLLASKLNTEKGSLHYLLGATNASRVELRAAVEALEGQSPWNLIELPRAYINLAAVESTTDDLDQAERLVQKTLDLYTRYALPDDAVIVEACNLRGTVMAQRGDYSKAIQHYREGLEHCSMTTLEAPLQRSNLLLNIALLHKSQGELPEAIKLCTEALAEFEKIADPDAVGFAAFDAGLANMYLAQNQIAKAAERTERILRLCKLHGIEQGPLVVTARHIRAIQALSRRDLDVAEENWRDLLKLQEREGQTLLLPRTLNYLGLTAELRNDRGAAESLYMRALKLQANNQRSFPATQFITLWRLANVVKGDRKAEGQRYLDQAIALVEKARLRTFGDAQQRATFFAQFGPAFEQSVEWLLENHDVESAFQVLTRGRSRTLMDQLQMSNLDPLVTLTGPKAEALKKREAALRQQLASLRAKAGLVGVEGLTAEEATKLLNEFDAAQAEYAETWREIWNASPEYHALADPNLPAEVLPKLRERVLKNKTVLLAYHIGKDTSQVMLVADALTPLQYFPLTVPEELQNIAPPAPRAPDHTLAELRGVKIVAKPGAKAAPAPVPLPPIAKDGKVVPLTQSVARALIEVYRQEILDREFQSLRGVVIKARDPNKPLPPQRPELTGQVFLPKALRDRLRELKPDQIVVVPDGPLHTLPLEALLLEAGVKPRFVIDELPPLIYAPSGSILAVLADRKEAPRRERATLLTVCNPAYLEGKASEATALAETREGGLMGFAGQLPRLPFTDFESKQVRRYFPKDRITAISDADATERNLVQAVRGKSIVHIAAHGFADPRFGNLFGALALAPPANPLASSDDDGFLSLHEIYHLPLQDCDLAVLSACLTHVGPQQPMEAGVTLANGFLSAGARRVVASHWNVADRSTSQLMSYFFEAFTRAPKDGRHLTAPQAMQEARLRLRASTEQNWSAPFFWAPFVVLGAPE
jgi:CHAT domain-containing protein/tetratricopeptide (TPR) repeat protein